MTALWDSTHKIVDGVLKCAVVSMPLLSYNIDSQLKQQNLEIAKQTKLLSEQKAAFEQSAKLRDMNLDLTEKFYQILGSEQFKCFDESKAPLLRPILDHYKGHIPEATKHIDADVIRVLYKQTLQNENCRASKEAQHLADPASTGSVDVPAQRSDVPADPAGWVAVGRFNSFLNEFANFSVFAEHMTSGELAGRLTPETVLRARWPVFLRSDASDAFEAPNPVLRVLSEGTCVKVLSSTDLGGQTWAGVTLEPRCREGNYY